MDITFDPAKNTSNLAKHGVNMSLAAEFEWDTAVTWPDVRRNYGESRMVGLGYIGDRLFAVAFVDRGEERRIISLRKANKREERVYAST